MPKLGERREKTTKAKQARPKHQEMLVKVNAMVDEGVAPLIQALSRFPHVCTVESCQGDLREQTGEAPSVVFFYYTAGNWKTATEFILNDLGFRLWEELGTWAHVAVCVVGDGLIQGELTVYPGALEMTTQVINELVDSYPTSACPKSEYSCDTFCTSQSDFQDHLHHSYSDDGRATGLNEVGEYSDHVDDVSISLCTHIVPQLSGRGRDEFDLRLPLQSPFMYVHVKADRSSNCRVCTYLIEKILQGRTPAASTQRGHLVGRIPCPLRKPFLSPITIPVGSDTRECVRIGGKRSDWFITKNDYLCYNPALCGNSVISIVSLNYSRNLRIPL